jgi:tetratricopeptide (TPR) repeat protein/tRNA A-37 threonylcarbamoyl transferase component Bud32
MSSAQLHRLKEIFHSAQQLRPNERPAFLDKNCGNDTELRREIDALLKSSQEADGFMVDPPAQLAAEIFGEAEIPADIGRTIGRYKLLQRIGSGGMGEVYLAERADQQFKMQVAIKLIKRGMDTESVLRRFQHERQILASLEHPNIARLLDGGETEDGLPYFVMEYVKGERIDRYAKAKNLSLNQRLELFRQACGAVSYAHQHLVVHRDLKPSNILVTPEGVPKLLDFGIAKIIQVDDGAETLATITAMPAMTPEYASPEQVRGEPMTTASDVYSLGVVLYELLTGQLPYRFTSQSPHDVSRVITDNEPKKPSTAITREGDHSKFQIRNSKLLKGDLDNIVLLALRKEPKRRYQSVDQFSEDIRRHLEERPVHARKDTVGYRAAKFVRRNKLALAAAAIVLIALVGGIITTSWEAHIAKREKARAERRFNEVRKLANNVLFDYHDAIKTLPGATKVRERLVKDGLNYLDSLASEAHGDPGLQRELGAAYERVGDVRGGESSGNLGDIAGAIESYTKALRIREALVAVKPDDPQARRGLASSHQKIGGRLLGTEEGNNGLEHLRKALTLYLDLTREQPANDDLQLELAATRNQLGLGMEMRGDLAGALEQHRTALASCEKLASSHPQDQRYRRELWSSQDRVGFMLSFENDVAGAMEANRKALALGEALLAEDPINADYRRRLVLTYQNGGDLRRESDKRGALEHFRRAAALNEELLVADPGNELTRRHLGYTHKKIADFLTELEDNSQALAHFRKALESYEKVAAEGPADLVLQFVVVTCHAGVARMQARLGEVDLALEECRKATALLQEIKGGKTGHIGKAQAYEYLGYAYASLAASPKATASEARQRMSTARDMFRQALNILDDLRSLRGTLGSNEQWARDIAGEIAKCDTALEKR